MGTTVKLTDLFHHLPVRKQTTLKDAAKNLATIKRLLQAYSLARPHLRLSLRIIKAKSDKGDYIYAPKTNATIDDAVTKAISRKCSVECAQSFFELQNHSLQAFLPRLDADYSGISGHGPFISIDCRPVATDRGIFKQMVSNFKDHLRQARFTTDTVKNPFMFLDISCPVGSYDPNIEPAKNDVLFDDTGPVLAAWQQMLDLMYPVAGSIELFGPRNSFDPVDAVASQVAQVDKEFNDENLRSNRAQRVNADLADPSGSSDSESASIHDAVATSTAQGWQTSMSSYDDEDMDLQSATPSRPRSSATTEDGRPLAGDPWTLAKLNSRIRPRDHQPPFRPPSMVRQTGIDSTAEEGSVPAPGRPGTQRLNAAMLSEANHRPERSTLLGPPIATSTVPPVSSSVREQYKISSSQIPSSPLRERFFTPPPFRNQAFLDTQPMLGGRSMPETHPPFTPFSTADPVMKQPRRTEKDNPILQADRNWFDFDQPNVSKRRKPAPRNAASEGADIRTMFEGQFHRPGRANRVMMFPSGEPDERLSQSSPHNPARPRSPGGPFTAGRQTLNTPEPSIVFKQSQPSSDIFSDKFQAVLDSQKRSSPTIDLQPNTHFQRPSTAIPPLECSAEQDHVQDLTLDIETSIAELDRLHELFSHEDDLSQRAEPMSYGGKDQYSAAFGRRHGHSDDETTLQRLELCLIAGYPQITDEFLWEILETAGELILCPTACPQSNDVDKVSDVETDYSSDL